MPSEKQIDTVARMLDPDAFTLEKTMLLMKGEMFGHHGDRVRAARVKAEELLTAAEQAETAPVAEPPADIIARVLSGWYGSNLDSGPFAAAAIKELERNVYFISIRPTPSDPAAAADPERKWPAFVYDSEAEPNMRTNPTPSEARLMEALEMIARIDLSHLSECRDIARAALKEASDDLA